MPFINCLVHSLDSVLHGIVLATYGQVLRIYALDGTVCACNILTANSPHGPLSYWLDRRLQRIPGGKHGLILMHGDVKISLMLQA